MCKQTIKNNSYLTKEILSKEILNHDLDGLRKDLLAFYEIRDSDVLNVPLRKHFPKREKLINRLVEIKLKELEIRQNGKKLLATVLFAGGAFLLSGIQEWRHFAESVVEKPRKEMVEQSPIPSEPIPQETSKLSKLDQTENSE